MTDTFDKLNHWYGWNGGERPVHPMTIVSVMTASGSILSRQADEFNWDYPDMPSTIVAFRIAKPYREPRVPREWWIVHEADIFDVRGSIEATRESILSGEIIHVREVLPEDEA